MIPSKSRGRSVFFCNPAGKSNDLGRLILTAMFIALLSSTETAHAKVIHVSAGQTTNSTPDGLSWTTAFPTVQKGLDAAAVGDEVRVAAATYPENITLKNAIALYGGFVGTETNLGQRNWSNNITILNGRRTNSVILVQPGAGPATRIDGFTISNGLLTGASQKGGGIVCSDASPVIANNIILSNSAASGGGIYCFRSAAMITNNVITQNSGVSGGGIYCLDSSATIARNIISRNRGATFPDGFGLGGGVYFAISSGIASDVVTLSDNTISENSAESGGGVECNSAVRVDIFRNTITCNQAGSYGGGIECYASSPTVQNNRFIGNTVTGSVAGGGISVFTLSGPEASPRILNNLFLANTGRQNSGSQGGGIYCSRFTKPVIVNNTLAGNLAGEGGGIFADSEEATIVNNLIVFGSSGMVALVRGTTNNCVFGNESGDFNGVGINGNISVDPRFSENLPLGDFHLLPNSPCRDTGKTAAVQPAWADLDGQPRIQGASVDIGADESDGTVFPFNPVVIRVSPTGDDRNSGSSWGLSKRTVQTAIDAASASGGEVWVKAGTYYERVSLKRLVYLFGGFDGTETNRSQRNWTTHRSALDGSRQGSVITAAGVGSWAAIDGLTIQNGRAANGGGIFCTNASPTIANNVIRTNASINGGGGGIYLNGSSSVVANNWVEGNATTGDGGAVYITARLLPVAKIINNVFLSNLATNNSNNCRGGAIYCDAVAEIINNTLLNNWARTGAPGTADFGGGIYCVLSGALFANNIIAFGSSGIRAQNALPLLRNNCVFGNLAFNYSGVAVPSGTNGNISVDPLLVNSNDFHLSIGSPCINTGDDSVVQPDRLDFDGHPRRIGRVDMGAVEAQFVSLSVQRLGTGPIGLHVEGPPGTNYILQAAGNLQSWNTISTNFGVPFDFTVLVSTNLPRRFFRVSSGP
jgi:hypothetical protein